ncbi:MAG: hypothetical protein KC933_15300 [Myxococcales bacterium]|nr:hypothetical protein [Myxococcales bacterium]MCB9650693.1 hypothetical protein [Deltaproteobacteria bacterium]
MLWPARACTLALLTLLACREDAAPPLAVETETPRDTVGPDPNPAPSPTVEIWVDGSPQVDLRAWSADGQPWSLLPENPAAYGLSAVLSTRVLSARSGEPLFYEVADERLAVLLRRDPDGSVQALRTRGLTAPIRTLAAHGRFEAWWDRGLWVQDFESTDEPRRYAVPEAIHSIPSLYVWGDHDLAAVVAGEDGWHAYRVSASGAPADLGVVGSLEDAGVWSSGGRLFFRHGEALTDVAPDGERTTIPSGGYYGTWVYGSTALFADNGTGATWVDFETGMTREVDGFTDDALAQQVVSRGGHVVLKRADGALGAFDMRTGEVRWVPDAVTEGGPYGVATDGRRLVVSRRDLEVYDVASGTVLHRWEGVSGFWALMLDEGQVLLQDVLPQGAYVVRRVALDTGAAEEVPGTFGLGLWGDTVILGPSSHSSEIWLAALGVSPPLGPFQVDPSTEWLERITVTPPRFLHSRLVSGYELVEHTLIDAQRRPIWRLETTLNDELWVSGDRVWRFDEEAETLSFLDLDVSPPELRSVVVNGASRSHSWPARSSIIVQVGDELVEVYADGAQATTRVLGRYTPVHSYSSARDQRDLWAMHGRDLHRFGLDGQASLRVRLPEGSRVSLAVMTEERVVVRAEVGGVDRYYSVAVGGAAESFEFSAAAIGVGLSYSMLDPQGRLVREEEGRLVAYGASEEPEVLLAPADGEVDRFWVSEGRWLALTRGAGGNQLWWSSPEGPRHVQASSVPMQGWFRPLGEGLILVSNPTGQLLVDLAERRVTRVPRDANGAWSWLEEGRLVGPVSGRDGLWVWDMRSNTLTPMLVPGFGWSFVVEVLPSRVE